LLASTKNVQIRVLVCVAKVLFAMLTTIMRSVLVQPVIGEVHLLDVKKFQLRNPSVRLILNVQRNWHVSMKSARILATVTHAEETLNAL
jgi:hypothetical protein